MKIVRETGSHFDLDEAAARRLLEDLLARPLFAHLATSSEQGPRESPVWFLWEDGALWIIGHYRTDSFPRRIEREPRCAIGIVDFDVSTGLVQHVGLRGRARLMPHDAERMKRLLSRYMGEVEEWDRRFVEILDDEDYRFIRFEPETVVVRDQSYQSPRHAASRNAGQPAGN
ncbi:MAG TPA: pyridoxamine 5'-phosphate oxidase family protein [Pyrinomonadaceae bacterium]|nr:pyridoxamine 5'-phosphate oxidase family protein [Pyrinomonadaceae bacterium]